MVTQAVVGKRTREVAGYLVADVDVPKILTAFGSSKDGKVWMVKLDDLDGSGFYSLNGHPYTNQFQEYEATFLKLASASDLETKDHDQTDEDDEYEDDEDENNLVAVEPHELQVYSEEHLFDQSDFYSYENDGYEDEIAKLLAEGGQLKPLASYRLLVWRGKIRSLAQYLAEEELTFLPSKAGA
jgi:hypothetical protein